MDIKSILDKEFIIFSDGACSGNPGPGGWGAVVVHQQSKIEELGGFADNTTNNRMELSATIHALRAISELPGEVAFYTDSTYVIRGITSWIWAWRKRNWQNAEGNEVSNRDLWEALFSITQDRTKKFGDNGKIYWLYSRGHSGTPGNERCDEIAVSFSQKKWVDLFKGELIKYSIPIFDLPENTDLPEMKPKQEKKKAYSYLSLLGGVVTRHWDWPSCERKVKGVSGAKFKKAVTAEDELKILDEWGLSADIKIRE